MSTGYERYASLDGFESDARHPDSFDAENGTFEYYRANPDSSQHIAVEGGFGYQRCVSTDPPTFVPEQDTFSVDYVEATPGLGLGTAALRQLVLEALASGLHVARIRIINPRAIAMVERLHNDSLVLAAYYKIDHESRLHPEAETVQFHEQAGLCTAEEAQRFLQANKQVQNPGEHGSVDSAVWF